MNLNRPSPKMYFPLILFGGSGGDIPTPVYQAFGVGAVKVAADEVDDGGAASPAFIEARAPAAGFGFQPAEVVEGRRVIPDVLKSSLSQIAAAELFFLHEGTGINVAAGVDAAGHLAGAAHIQAKLPSPVL